ncbi:MAG: class IV adenylate cyclase, partial [Gammaproteobacteria bacterium]|nr:class IV adenylate cyclase [Gammaproteobacteria bacterium]
MPSNIEIKARLDDINIARSIAEKLSDQPVKIIKQHDTFFFTATERLKLRDFTDGTGELIYYAREDTPDPTGSTYQISPTNDPKGLCVLLRDALGSRGDIEKIRYLY